MALPLNTEMIINLNLIAEPPADVLAEITPLPAGFCQVKYETRARAIALLIHNAAPAVFYRIGQRFCNFAITPDGFAKLRMQAVWQERDAVVIGVTTEEERLTERQPDAHALLRRSDRMLITLFYDVTRETKTTTFIVREGYWRGTTWESLPPLTWKQFRTFIKTLLSNVLKITMTEDSQLDSLVAIGDTTWLADIGVVGG